ncbi:hypothetical protein BS50DRAFT_633309 [Corynespora cassiicola Philippines]|uniref:RING-type domain-containing protein n=1 Tax=Corynespora cassiicola Philippines TaxID=1448308 RepID=A0A2T2NQ84_CORCC|nr:hypothetical protein BS50DRAFT_633309 [Corynespora cassiicola Philippines]
MEMAMAMEKRRLDDNKSNLGGTAIGFLVPLFIVFLCGPFICILFVRHRRPTRPLAGPARQPRLPVLRRDEARSRLDDVTHAVGAGVTKEKEVWRLDARLGDEESALERECAICLCSLHAPSPPKPAKLALEKAIPGDGTSAVLASSKPPSISNISIHENEEILKLKSCGHEFHAECLVSWCILRKYSCPICRAVYFQSEDVKAKSEEQTTETIERVETGEERDANRGNGRRREGAPTN